MRMPDKNVSREANKTLKQFEKNIFKTNHFMSLGIIMGSSDEDDFLYVKIVPSMSYRDFERELGYKIHQTDNTITKCLVPVGQIYNVGDLVLVTFTDVNYINTLNDIKKGKDISSVFSEDDKTTHSYNFGIIILKIL